jgi:hypothetical protein
LLGSSGNSRRADIKELPILRMGWKVSAGQVMTWAAVAFALYVGGSAAYVLGVIVGLPSQIATLINHATVVHLSGQLTFITLIIVALFKVSRLIVVGLVFFWNFVICKFYLAPKRPRGLRNPVVLRLQRRMNNAVVEGRTHGRVIFFLRILIALAFCVHTFLPIVTGSVTTQPYRIVQYSTFFGGGLLAIVFSMSAFGVFASRTLTEFFNSPQGRKLAVVTLLYFCMVFGMARAFTMMQGPTVYYTLGLEVCQLAPMMPVYGGNLYYDRETFNFVVLSSDKIAFYIPHLTSQKAPACI